MLSNNGVQNLKSLIDGNYLQKLLMTSIHNYRIYWVMADYHGGREVLEAEGELNREIQAALASFRQKIVLGLSPTKNNSQAKNYDSYKEGPEKRFVFRESLLSIMFQVKDFRTIYNMVVASFIILTFSLFYDGMINRGQIINLRQLFKFFNGFTTIVSAWIIMCAFFYTIIPITKLALKCSIYIWLPIYATYIVMLIKIATYFSQGGDHGFASIVVMMAESVRMVMKSHSYFRTKLMYLKENKYHEFEFRGIKVVNSPKNDRKDEQKNGIMHINIKNGDFFEQFKKITYFLFCPTLIYRDQYTLTPLRSVKRILIHLINFCACIYYAFMLYQTWCKPVIQRLQKNLSFQSLSFAIINLMLPSVLFLIFGFFGFLHSWMNLWSQITRFPDRAFYSDWWNSWEFGSYYRKWNIVVHDWLYYYIYLDLYRLSPKLPNMRSIAQLSTFIISAIIHELIIYYSIGFFYPILFILFAGPGILFVQISSLRTNSVNLIFWLEMYIGTAIMFTLYLVECFARNKVSSAFIEEQWGTFSALIPRTFYLGYQ